MHSQYLANLAAGELFQDYVADVYLQHFNVEVGMYTTKAQQVAFGESRLGVECKYDRIYHRTNNFFIETHERHDVSAEYKPSGPFHENRPNFICIGSHKRKEIWTFRPEDLQAEHASGQWPERENAIQCGLGFLLPVDRASEICVWRFAGDKVIETASL